MSIIQICLFPSHSNYPSSVTSFILIVLTVALTLLLTRKYFTLIFFRGLQTNISCLLGLHAENSSHTSYLKYIKWTYLFVKPFPSSTICFYQCTTLLHINILNKKTRLYFSASNFLICYIFLPDTIESVY